MRVGRVCCVFAAMLWLFCAAALAERVDFGAAGDVQTVCDYLSAHPDVRYADMYESELTREEMALLAEQFPNVNFGWTLHIGDHTLRTDATAFSTLHNNKSKTHTSEDFDVLRYCYNLLALDLGHNDIDDISFLSELPQLRVLILGRNRIEDISVLAQLTQLEYAELFSNRIRDVSALSELTGLLDLNLTNNPVQSLAPLHGMTALERLWCGMNDNLTRFGILTMRDSVPGIEIDSESHPTGGTWRTHARYEVIRTMFGSGEYIPFSP